MANKSNPVKKQSINERNRREAQRAVKHKKQQRQRWIIGAIGVAVLVLVGVLVVKAIMTPKPGQAVANMGNAHITETQIGSTIYNSTPPTSGPHLGNLASWGVHSQPIPNEQQIHNLEDGGVVIQYNCPDGCEDLVAQLSAIVKKYEEQVVLAPYPGMDSRIALTAWTRIDKFDDFDAQRIERFIKAYRGIDHHVSGQG